MLPVVTPSECRALLDDGAVLVDLRDSAAFGASHPPGAINVRFDERRLAERVELILGGKPRVLLLPAETTQIEPATRLLASAGIEAIGVVGGTAEEWAQAEAPWVSLPSLTTADLQDEPDGRRYHVLDVREPMEWAVGHVPGAQLIALGDVGARFDEVPRDRDVAVICEGGVRSSSAASILQAAGFTRVFNVADGTAGWRTAERPMQVTEETED